LTASKTVIVHVERYSKQSDDTWSPWETDVIDDVVRLESVGVKLAVSEMYFKIDFELPRRD